MAQAISNLSLGEKIWINDNGVDALYEIAGFDVHGENTATLVRSVVSELSVSWEGNSSQHYDYEDSPLDYQTSAYEQRFSARHRARLKNTAVICQEHTGSFNTIVRKVFALSGTEAGVWNDGENAPLPLYTSNASRIKEGPWPLRSIVYIATNPAGNRWTGYQIKEDGAPFGYSTSYGYIVPAFVINADIPVSDSAVGDGYEIYFPDAEAIATPIFPYGDYVQIDQDITFVWTHSAETETAQTRADIQYRAYGAAWQDLQTIAGADNIATIPAHTFAPGRFFWRVRTYNEDGVPGPWSSEAAFVCVGAPAAPIITSVEQTNRPVVAWESSGQIGYQVQIGEYDTGEIGGQAKTHKIPYYIHNGIYAARVRIKGASLLWSAWTEQEFSIDVTGPANPTLEATAIPGAAMLTFAAPGAEKLYLLRDGVPIANVTGLTSYTDYAALGSAVYILRAVDASDNFTDSDPVGVTVTVPCVTMAAVDSLTEFVQMHMKKSGQPGVSRQKDIMGSAHYYAGRTFPVYRFSGFTSEQYAPAFYYTNGAEFAKLEELVDKRRTILYRDNLGNKYYGVITGITHTQENSMYEFALAIMRNDYVEQIDYEV